MRSQQVVQSILEYLDSEIKSQKSKIDYFLNTTLAGGWEAWLQVEIAYYLLNKIDINTRGSFEREIKYYPETTKKSDLKIIPKKGTNIWMEIKTQRNDMYKNAISDYEKDIKKIESLKLDFKANEVLIALVIFKVNDIQKNQLKEVFGNHCKNLDNIPNMKIYAWTEQGFTGLDSVNALSGFPDNTLMVSTFRNQ